MKFAKIKERTLALILIIATCFSIISPFKVSANEINEGTINETIEQKEPLSTEGDL